MTDKTWKAVERRVAAKLGGRRIPLSGRNNLGRVGDIDLTGFEIECKSGRQIPKTVIDWLKTLLALRDPKNLAVLVMQPKYIKGQVVVMTLDDLARLLNAFKYR